MSVSVADSAVNVDEMRKMNEHEDSPCHHLKFRGLSTDFIEMAAPVKHHPTAAHFAELRALRLWRVKPSWARTRHLWEILPLIGGIYVPSLVTYPSLYNMRAGHTHPFGIRDYFPICCSNYFYLYESWWNPREMISTVELRTAWNHKSVVVLEINLAVVKVIDRQEIDHEKWPNSLCFRGHINLRTLRAEGCSCFAI